MQLTVESFQLRVRIEKVHRIVEQIVNDSQMGMCWWIGFAVLLECFCFLWLVPSINWKIDATYLVSVVLFGYLLVK